MKRRSNTIPSWRYYQSIDQRKDILLFTVKEDYHVLLINGGKNIGSRTVREVGWTKMYEKSKENYERRRRLISECFKAWGGVIVS